MSLNLRLARIRGIDVSIHWTFWLLPLWIIFTWQGGGLFPLWMHLLLIASLFVCVVLHEFGHAFMAEYFGIRTRSITLSPLGGIAQLERMSQKPWEEFCIAIAGPLVNVAIVAALGSMLFISGALIPGVAATSVWEFGGVLLLLNGVMIVFNLIPAFPMDGGRVLRAALAHWLGLLEGTRVAVSVGTGLAIVMGVVGAFILGNPWMLLISLFVILAGRQELAALEFEEEQRRAEAEGNLRMTFYLWDPRRGGVVRRTFGDGADANTPTSL